MGNASPIRILIADDHPLMRRGLTEEINGQPDMQVVAEAQNGREAIEMFAHERPDVCLIDLRMPGLDGIEVLESIRGRYPSARIIILTTAMVNVQIVRAFRAGAFSYVLKNMMRVELMQTIRAVHSGRKRIPESVAAVIAEHALDDNLSNREVAVLKSASNGNSNKMIADCLDLSEHTVKSHFKNILSKLRANDRTHAVTIAMKRGYLENAER